MRHHLRRAHPALAAVSLVLVTTACSVDDHPVADRASTTVAASNASNAGGAPSACSLLTSDEVARTLDDHNAGSTYTAQLDVDPAGENACVAHWESNGSGDEFTISVFDADGYVADPSGPDPRPIDGIGDEAFEVDGSYYARVGDEMINIVNVQEGEGTDEALLGLAAGRLAHG